MAHAMHFGSRWHAARMSALRRAVAPLTRRRRTARYAGNLANALRQRQESARGGGDLRETIQLHRPRQTCARGIETATAVAFYAARDWAAWAAARQAWPEAASAYEFGVPVGQEPGSHPSRGSRLAGLPAGRSTVGVGRGSRRHLARMKESIQPLRDLAVPSRKITAAHSPEARQLGTIAVQCLR